MKKRNRTPSTWGPVPKKDRPEENVGVQPPMRKVLPEERPSLASIRSSTSTSAVMSRASPWKSWSSCFSKPSTTLSIMPSMRSMAAEMFSPSTSWSSSWA